MYTLKLQWEIMFQSLTCTGIISNRSTLLISQTKNLLSCTWIQNSQNTSSPSQLSAYYFSQPTTAGPKFFYHCVLLSIFTQLHSSSSQVQSHGPYPPNFALVLKLKLECLQSPSSLEHSHLGNGAITCVQYLPYV